MEHEGLETQDDQSLMLAVRDGDVGRLGVLFERHHGQLFSFLLHLTGDRSLSEDLLQEVFIRILKYRHTFRPDSQFTTWMFQIARNARIDHFRKNPANEVSIDSADEHVSLTLPAGEQVEQQEELRILLEGLSRLSEEKRTVLLLRGFQGLKFEDIAKVMKCPVNTVKSRAFKAIRELRQSLRIIRGEQTSWNATG